MIHNLKLDSQWCHPVFIKTMSFNIRKNDRDFKAGDFIHFVPWDFKKNCEIKHDVSTKIFRIYSVSSIYDFLDYFLNFDYSCDDDIVVISFAPLSELSKNELITEFIFNSQEIK